MPRAFEVIYQGEVPLCGYTFTCNSMYGRPKENVLPGRRDIMTIDLESALQAVAYVSRYRLHSAQLSLSKVALVSESESKNSFRSCLLNISRRKNGRNAYMN